MEHQFNVQLAQKYGIEEAILIHNLFFWINKNAANEKHFHDGHYWTYNSQKAFSELFPYMSEDKIQRTLKKLCQSGIIIKGNYNDAKFDKTCWYAFTDNFYTVLQNAGFDTAILRNGLREIAEPIPYSKHTDNKKEKEIAKAIKKKSFDVRAELSYVSEDFLSLWNEWLDYKDEIGKQYKTQRGAKMQYSSWIKFSDNNPILANAIIKRSIEQSWDGLFALTDKQKEFFLSDKSPYRKESYISNTHTDNYYK